ncbi:Holliday junction resolvase Hjc [Sulfuracidifex tepidarius]|uniref:Holliday junction resolvase Hjc n=1 Tax=Sulfuracidifex tepidarius TaxID=1294262 RepID=A0A510DUU4_9CREN|nr:Holliday junction resolvase Hjc [Sulfuracidifex tepidarius]BBG23996.1 Holliday junction resolvase Hjc [Sulfuracidifex tepidarius]BBG26751.1 Holliday junction resolvase Hjc [Sulfuracidifex tepidarius]
MNPRKRKGTSVELFLFKKLRDKGFAVTRAPASGSKRKDPIPDIIAMKKGIIVLIELKSRSKEGKIYVSKEQAEGAKEFADKSGGYLFLGIKTPSTFKFLDFSKLRSTKGGNYVADEPTVDKEGLSFEDLLKFVDNKLGISLDTFFADGNNG